MPENAESITATAIVEDDWSEVAFEYRDAAGNTGHFTHATNPDGVADQIADMLDELRTRMTGHGTAAWNRADMTAHRSGEFGITFSRDDDRRL